MTEITTHNAQQTPLARITRTPLVRFFLVSMIATLLNMVIYESIIHLPEFPRQITVAAAVGYMVGTVVNFFIARRWVFRPTAMHSSLEFVLVTVVGLVGWGLTVGMTEPLTRFVDARLPWSHHLSATAAYTVAVLVAFVWNFIGRKLLIYRGKMTAEAPMDPEHQ